MIRNDSSLPDGRKSLFLFGNVYKQPMFPAAQDAIRQKLS
jgi:hypothetical protein